MKKFAHFVVSKKNFFLLLSLILIIPSIIGYFLTKTNYDILVYLPSDIETLKGQKILTDDFKMGAFSVSVVENISDYELTKLEENIRKIDGVSEVVSINDITGTTIPLEMIPKKILDKVSKGNSKLMLITFEAGTSDVLTTEAVNKISALSKEIKVGGMSSMVNDTNKLFESQTFLYVFIAVLCCLIILTFALDSYFIPLILLGNIGVSILFNMGTNVFLGEISYITKAIAAVLQLGVTTDFSIFLYHKYEAYKKKYDNKERAMEEAICETMVSVIGSSLTTIAGFLALCSMKLTLGTDIGLVMAKGVIFGVITVLTLYPALILTFDRIILKAKHQPIIPKFKFVIPMVKKGYRIIFMVFLLLLIPTYLSQKKTPIYYNLDSSIPENYDYSIASKKLKDDYQMNSQAIVLVNSMTSNAQVNAMIDEINKLDGIDNVLSMSLLSKSGLDENILPQKIRKMIESDDYKLVLINSNYDIATNELNNQIKSLNTIVKKYDDQAIVAGEGPLMNDLVEITAIDFKNVNYVSIGVIFIIMFFVLKSFSLPILLVSAIEFAIFINMGFPYWQGVSIPFVSSIVIGTIQLGATIDYAILLTTKYLDERKKGRDKLMSISEALGSSVSSIFVSAMCFFGATFGVYAVSKIDMISSLCLLMARGAIISMAVVMFIVPSILLIFDKIIIHTTLGFKKGKEKMKKGFIKKGLVTLLIIGELISTTNVYALTKEESVYAKLKSNGEVDKITVSEHLSNYQGNKINDQTILNNIKNINGDEKYRINGKNILWEGTGQDIYYQGVLNKNLPISLNVKYYLNGQEKDINEMLGQKGKVKIVLTYQNHLSQKVLVNGRYEKLYVPFMIVTTSIINNVDNKNIKVTNGKIIDNGISSFVVSLASPGLYESLKTDELKNLDKVEISYETDNFALNSIYSVATSNMFDDSNLNIFDEVNELYKKINALQSNMDTIVGASKKLNDGSVKLNAGMTELNTKMQELINKYRYFRGQDENTLKEALIEIVQNNIKLITPGLEDEITKETSKIIKENKKDLAKDVLNYTKKNTQKVLEDDIKDIISKLDLSSIISKMMNSHLADLLTNDADIEKITKELKEDINKELKSVIAKTLETINDNISVNNSGKEEYINKLAEKYGVTAEQAEGIISDVQDDVIKEIKTKIQKANIAEKIITSLNNKDYLQNLVQNYVQIISNKLKTSLLNDEAFKQYEKLLREKIMKALEKDLSEDEIYLNLDIKKHLEDLIDKIIDNTTSDLANKYTDEYTGQIVHNIIEKQFDKNNIDSKLREVLGMYQNNIKEKVSFIDETVNALSDALNKLNDGSNQLSNGMNALSKGLDKYNKEGINKLSKIVNGDVKSYQKRLESLINLSKKYQTVDETSNKTKGSSRIIFMIDAISKPTETKKVEIKKEENSNLWDKIVGLFK